MGSALSYENQYIFDCGFKNVKNFFFKTLCDKQAYSMQNVVNYISVVFYIVPMINAMIRMGTMSEKERLFLAFIDGQRLVPSNKRGAKGTMEKVAIESARECTNAKSHQNTVRDKMVDKLSFKIEKDGLLDNKVLFIKLDDTDIFPAELNGLIAMMCTTLYKRPTIIARVNEEGLVRGSIRGLSNSEFDNFKGFLDESGFFNYVRGHAQAAGMEIAENNLEAFHNYANKALEKYDFNEDFYPVDFIRCPMDKDLKDLILDIAENDYIWGTGNPTPMVYVKDIIFTPDDMQIMGANQDTMKISKNGIEYIQFRAGELIKKIREYDVVSMSVVGTMSVNHWSGRSTPQIMISNWEVQNGEYTF
jgi:single-stranded-DNA-specific exonuclease